MGYWRGQVCLAGSEWRTQLHGEQVIQSQSTRRAHGSLHGPILINFTMPKVSPDFSVPVFFLFYFVYIFRLIFCADVLFLCSIHAVRLYNVLLWFSACALHVLYLYNMRSLLIITEKCWPALPCGALTLHVLHVKIYNVFLCLWYANTLDVLRIVHCTVLALHSLHFCRCICDCCLKCKHPTSSLSSLARRSTGCERAFACSSWVSSAPSASSVFRLGAYFLYIWSWARWITVVI